jgi:hypothetical protein
MLYASRYSDWIYGMYTVADMLQKTNNSVEGWHRGFKSSLSCYHPLFWKFIKQLEKEEVLEHKSLV